MTRAESYQSELEQEPISIPDGARVLVQIAVFDDESIHVGGPNSMGMGEMSVTAALVSALRVYGYKVELTRDLTLVDGVRVHSSLDSLTGVRGEA